MMALMIKMEMTMRIRDDDEDIAADRSSTDATDDCESRWMMATMMMRIRMKMKATTRTRDDDGDVACDRR